LIDEDQRLLSVEHGASLQRVLTALPGMILRDTASVTFEVSDVSAAMMKPESQFRCLVASYYYLIIIIIIIIIITGLSVARVVI